MIKDKWKMKAEIVFDLETTGLDPLQDRIVAVGVKTPHSEFVINHDDEKRILQAFWCYLRKIGYFRLVGFNSSNFDVPFLIVRSIKHSVRMVDVRGKSVDLRQLCFLGRTFRTGTLDEFSRLIGFPPKLDGLSGKDVPALYNQGKLELIKNYLLQDLRMTWALFQRCKEVGLV